MNRRFVFVSLNMMTEFRGGVRVTADSSTTAQLIMTPAAAAARHRLMQCEKLFVNCPRVTRPQWRHCSGGSISSPPAETNTHPIAHQLPVAAVVIDVNEISRSLYFDRKKYNITDDLRRSLVLKL